MIVKMKFINISGPRADIDRVTDLSFQIRDPAGVCTVRAQDSRQSAPFCGDQSLP